MAIPQNGRYICITWGQRQFKNIKTLLHQIPYSLHWPDHNTFFSTTEIEYGIVDTSILTSEGVFFRVNYKTVSIKL